ANARDVEACQSPTPKLVLHAPHRPLRVGVAPDRLLPRLPATLHLQRLVVDAREDVAFAEDEARQPPPVGVQLAGLLVQPSHRGPAREAKEVVVLRLPPLLVRVKINARDGDARR